MSFILKITVNKTCYQSILYECESINNSGISPGVTERIKEGNGREIYKYLYMAERAEEKLQITNAIASSALENATALTPDA